jgi:hypothetical protein
VTDEPTLDSMATATLDVQLGELESRLVHDYGAERRPTVHALVEQERVRFANARIHAFVPILMERSIRSRMAQ